MTGCLRVTTSPGSELVVNKNSSVISGVPMRGRQTYRFARLGLNLFAGSAFIQSCFQFPSISKIDQRYLNDYGLFRFWVDDLKRSMNTEIHVHGRPMQQEGMFVSNHISWLDTIILNRVKALSFVARHDLAEWPFLGKFTQRMSSVFIDRSNKFQAYRSIPALEERLNQGRSVVVFPESTTSDGTGLLPFYPMFYEAAVRTRSMIQPIAIRYTDGLGKQIVEPAFINEDSFLDTLSRILWVDKVHAHLCFLEPIDAQKVGRKKACALSRDQIQQALVQFGR